MSRKEQTKTVNKALLFTIVGFVLIYLFPYRYDTEGNTFEIILAMFLILCHWFVIMFGIVYMVETFNWD